MYDFMQLTRMYRQPPLLRIVTYLERRTRCCVVGSGIVPQAGSIPDEVIRFLNCHNSSSRTMALGSAQPLTEMSPGIFLGVKGGRRDS
jgi:hypothetical protein